MTSIVTGSNGFIGKNLIKKLNGSDIIEIDIDNRELIFQKDFKWDGVSTIYHLGAISNTTEKNINKIHELNIDYSLRLFELAIDKKIPIVHASSASVYGNSSDGSMNPLNYYAISKYIIDLWIQDNKDRFSNIRSYRFFNVYGPHEDHKGDQASPIHKFTAQAKTNGVINVFDVEAERDFVLVTDICNTLVDGERESGIYDLGTGRTESFKNIANIIAEKYNATVEVIPFPDHLKNKYQYSTCANELNTDFVTVKDYISNLT